MMYLCHQVIGIGPLPGAPDEPLTFYVSLDSSKQTKKCKQTFDIFILALLKKTW